MTIYFILTLKVPFARYSDIQAMKRLERGDRPVLDPPDVSPSVWDMHVRFAPWFAPLGNLLGWMVHQTPESRPRSNDVIASLSDASSDCYHEHVHLQLASTQQASLPIQLQPNDIRPLPGHHPGPVHCTLYAQVTHTLQMNQQEIMRYLNLNEQEADHFMTTTRPEVLARFESMTRPEQAKLQQCLATINARSTQATAGNLLESQISKPQGSLSASQQSNQRQQTAEGHSIEQVTNADTRALPTSYAQAASARPQDSCQAGSSASALNETVPHPSTTSSPSGLVLRNVSLQDLNIIDPEFQLFKRRMANRAPQLRLLRQSIQKTCRS